MEADTVFSDCFDTVLNRKTHPYVFGKVWAQDMKDAFALSVSAEKLFSMRLRCMRDCAAEKKYAFAEAMSALFDALKNMGELSGADLKTFSDAALEFEMRHEMPAQQLNKKVFALLQSLKNRGKKIYIVSDFHLGKDALAKFFKNAGIPAGFFDDIFVSCDFGKQKSDGSLYDAVLRELSADPKSCLMIGDDARSDVQMAKARGIQTKRIFAIGKIRNSILRRFVPPQSARRKFLKTRLCACADADFPFAEYAVLFYAAMRNLYAKARADGVENLIFLAREGFFLKKLFDEYQKIAIPPALGIGTQYIKVSRHSLITLAENTFENPLETSDISPAEFLQSVGIAVAAAKKLPELSAVDFDAKIADFGESPEYAAMKNSPALRRMYEAASAENLAAFLEYLGGFGTRNAAVVDVGWNGTMQMLANRISHLDMRGYYLGIVPEDKFKKSPEWLAQKRESLLFSAYPAPSPFFHFFNINKQLYEMLLGAPHGSARSYAKAPDGGILIGEFWNENEKSLYKNTISKWQQNALENFRRLYRDFANSPADEAVDAEVLGMFVARKSIFASARETAFLQTLDKSFFGMTKAGLKYTPKKISPAEVLVCPEKYLRFLAKLHRVLNAKKIGFVYAPIAAAYWCYTLAAVKLRGFARK